MSSLSSLLLRARQRALVFVLDVCLFFERVMMLDDAEYLGLMIVVAGVLLFFCFVLGRALP